MNPFRNERGLTLVEVLAALTLVTIISVMAMNIFLSGQKTVTRTVSETISIDELRYAHKIIGKDIRSSNSIIYRHDTLMLTIQGMEKGYMVDSEGLKVNGALITAGIGELEVKKQGQIITVRLMSVDSGEGTKEVDSVYTLREGVSWQHD